MSSDSEKELEDAKRDIDFENRKSRGLTPWPNSREQNLINQFGIFAAEEEIEEW